MGKLKEALKHGEDAIFHEPNNADRHYLVGVIQRAFFIFIFIFLFNWG